MPHIYADTFEALGYALGYLQMEDYGERVPLGLLRARGELALHVGRAALDADFVSAPYYQRAVEVYSRLQQDTRDVYEGFAAGVNRYLAQHPEAFAGWVADPFTGYDVAALYVSRASAGQTRRWISRLTGAPDAPLLDIERDDTAVAGDPLEAGSSAWALAPSRTTSGAAILLRNPHLSWDAGYWEAHAVVPGRLDFYGDFRIGAPVAIGSSSMRGVGNTGVVTAARTHLGRLDLRPFGTRHDDRFRAELNSATTRLRAVLPEDARHWGPCPPCAKNGSVRNCL